MVFYLFILFIYFRFLYCPLIGIQGLRVHKKCSLKTMFQEVSHLEKHGAYFWVDLLKLAPEFLYTDDIVMTLKWI